ncbi:MAG: carboxypeptidase-like regulatory domain-containing protein [Paludibacteraceae bacterium]|nr:carboxypeptidase-like regulatory domain-containing protein [Paludibacteraceae bacterium]
MRFSNLPSRFLVLIFVIAFTNVYAQKGSIKGVILDSGNKEPLIGAAVMIKGTTNGSASNLDGECIIENLAPGKYIITTSYISYKPFEKANVVVEAGKETIVDILLESANIALKEVELVVKANRESENILLLQQKQSLIATQAVGAKEMSRKGISDAEGAVSKISGISKQEGVKNVFVRGLGDRYNVTKLNGFMLPSEDPSFKNIALEFFSNNIIQSIGVNKVFSSSMTGDVGGAVIDISSKELVGDGELEFGLSSSLNNATIGQSLFLPEGMNRFGYSPASSGPLDKYATDYSFNNSLSPVKVNSPYNYGFSFSGGKMFHNKHSFFVAGSLDNKYRYEEGVLREITASNASNPFVDMTYTRSLRSTSHLLLGNLDLNFTNVKFDYNILYIHSGTTNHSDRYGKHVETFQVAEEFNSEGLIRWQQVNDNTLLVNQLSVNGNLSERLKYYAGAAVNYILGNEPDRRIFRFPSMGNEKVSFHHGENRSRRFSTELSDFSVVPKLNLQYKLSADSKNTSLIEVGYDARISNKDFRAPIYNHTWNKYKLSELPVFENWRNINLDNHFNQNNLSNNLFEIEHFNDTYNVFRNMHSGYADLIYQLGSSFTLNAGVRADYVNIKIDYEVSNGSVIGTNTIEDLFFSPSFNLKYELNNSNHFRFGASRTFTLPQDIEISPFVREGFDGYEVGNPELIASTNYNADLKWDFYISGSEYLSVNGFYKHILNPIARLDMANSAGIKTFSNIGDYASAAGVELELRKNVLSFADKHRINLGVNASYIYTKHSGLDENLFVQNVNSGMEGASPYIVNADLTYSFVSETFKMNSALIINYLGDKIHTIGTRGFNNLIEESITTLDFVNSITLNNKLGIALKMMNLLNSAYTQIRKGSDENVPSAVIRSYKKGINFDLSITYKF